MRNGRAESARVEPLNHDKRDKTAVSLFVPFFPRSFLFFCVDTDSVVFSRSQWHWGQIETSISRLHGRPTMVNVTFTTWLTLETRQEMSCARRRYGSVGPALKGEGVCKVELY